MKRIYHPYWEWEDYQHGMFNNGGEYTEAEEEQLAHTAKELLSNQQEFYESALRMVTQWKKAAEQNLTNQNRNRQAWIGQATCCFKINIPERITKYGWRLMSPEQQNEANATADKIIKIWELDNAEKNIKQKCL